MSKQIYPRVALMGATALLTVMGARQDIAAEVPPAYAKAAKAGPAAIEDVVVTATRRSERLQTLPSSIIALPESFLKNSASHQLEDIVRAVPGLAYTENSVGQAVLAIRGIQTSSAFSNIQSPVAIYYDEVPILDPFVPWEVPQLGLFDINRVEVLKGPQGTLFGAGALSGAIRVITNKPNLTEYQAATEDTVDGTVGGSPGYATNLMVNLPLVQNKLAVRAVGYYDDIGGYINNPTLNEKNGNHAEVYGGRLEVSLVPSEDLSFNATFSDEVTQPHDSNYLPYGSTSYVADNRLRNYNNDDTRLFNLVSVYSLGWATFTSSTSYLYRNAYSQIDFSGDAQAVTHLPGVSPLIDTFETSDFIQEVRLASSNEHPYKWLVGAFIQNYHFYSNETISQAGVAGLGYASNDLEAYHPDAKIVDQAAFGEASYDIIPQLTLTAGARYSHFSVGTDAQYALAGTDIFDGTPKSIARPATFDKLTPKFSLSYTPAKDIMLYVLADKGYRNGQANLSVLKDPITGQAIPPSYQPDELWNYEVGAKTAFFDHRLIIDADAYYIDWSKIILQQVTGSGINYVGNAGTAHVHGVELQVVAKPIEPLEIGTSISYNDAKMVAIEPGVDAKVGDQLPGSAPFTAYFYGQYEVPLSDRLDGSLRLDYSYTGREFSYLDNVDNPSALRYGDYGSLGAQASVRFGRYEFMLFASNLADSKGRTGARLLYPEAVEVLQAPLTIGLTFRAHY